MKKNKKEWIIIAVILVVIIILVVILAVNSHSKKTAATTTTAPSSTAQENQEATIPENDEDAFYEINEGDGGPGGLSKPYIKKVGSAYYLYDAEGRIYDTGLYYLKMPGHSKANCYYFSNGKFDKKYKGVESPPIQAGLPDHFVYIKNGTIDHSYTGLVSKDKYLRIFENGKYRQDYNGKVHLPDGDFDVHHGAVYGYCLGQPDGFEWKPVFWSLDGEPVAYHKS